jgi:3-dehydroquinate dehydratase type I
LKGLFGKDRVCGVIAAGTAREKRAHVLIGLRKTGTLELRLDYLRSAREREVFLSWLGRKRRRAVLIATCRRKEGGGLFQGSREEQIEILAQAARSGCDWCDVEIETAKHIARGELAQRRETSQVSLAGSTAWVSKRLRSQRNAILFLTACASVNWLGPAATWS